MANFDLLKVKLNPSKISGKWQFAAAALSVYLIIGIFAMSKGNLPIIWFVLIGAFIFVVGAFVLLFFMK